MNIGRKGGLMEHCQEHSAHERAIEQHDHRLDTHGKSLDTLSETLAALREIERQNQERIDRMDERLAALESEPADKWRRTSDYVLTAILGVVLGLVASNFGL